MKLKKYQTGVVRLLEKRRKKDDIQTEGEGKESLKNGVGAEELVRGSVDFPNTYLKPGVGKEEHMV
jgi:hypothetical protein